ncbi:MAG: cupredoxin domain-containing protein [Gemmataceae bacterium]
MRRFSFGLVMATLPAFALSLMLAGCGGDKDKGPSGGGGGSGGSGGSADQSAQKKELKVLDPGKGVLKGKIKLNGVPDLKALTNQLHEDMKKKDTEYCMKGKESETTEQAYRVGKDNTLGNVFVWVIPEPGTFFKVTDEMLKELPKKVETHQPHCAFIPHCLFHFPQYHPDPKKPKEEKSTGQIWEVHNDAEVGHNTKFEGGSANKGDNVTLPTKAKPRPFELFPDTKEITIACNIHPWMKAYMRVVDTPYYAISLSDTLDGKNMVEKDDPRFGTYEIKNLPAAKVRVLAWHETLGYLNKDGGKGEAVEISADKPTEKNFEASGK